MAIIKCNECGNGVSEMAEACPQCGYPIKKTTLDNTEVTSHHKPELGFLDYVQASLSSPFAYGGTSLAGFYALIAIPFAGLEVLEAAVLIIIAMFSGALLHFLIFQLPVISLGQIVSGGPIRKVIGLLGVSLLAFLIYSAWVTFPGSLTKKDMVNQENSTKSINAKPKITKQDVMQILNENRTRAVLPEGVAGSSVIPTKEETIKRQCGSCATNLHPNSAVANNKSIISNCATIKQECNDINITW